MMGRLRAMREPLKYVQGRNALLKFQEEMGYMGTRWLFVCSKSGYQACHDKLEESFGQREDYRRYEIFGGVSSHSEIDKMKAIVEEDKIDTVVAVSISSSFRRLPLPMRPVPVCPSSTTMTTALINTCSTRRTRTQFWLTPLSSPTPRSNS